MQKYQKLSQKWIDLRQQEWDKRAKKTYWENFLKTIPPRVAKNLLSGKYSTDNIPVEFPIPSKFIYGPPCSGKTMAVYGALWEHLEHIQLNYAIHSKFTHKVIHLGEFLHELQNAFKERDRYATMMDSVLQCDLLIIDDFGTEKLTEWVYSQIYMIVNHRYNQMLPTWYTSNYSLKELQNSILDERILRRVTTDCDIIQFTDIFYV